MQCANCKYPISSVVRTLPNDDRQDYIQRRRECQKCLYRWTTLEKIKETPVKKDYSE